MVAVMMVGTDPRVAKCCHDKRHHFRPYRGDPSETSSRTFFVVVIFKLLREEHDGLPHFNV
jgi:hypothetical protein